MKKFYTMALALGVAAVAFAGTPQRQQMVDTKIQKTNMAQKVEVPASLRAKAPAKAGSFANVQAMAGEWELQYEGLLNGSSGTQIGTINLEVVNASAGTVSFKIGNFSIQATVDLSAKTFSIANKQLVGADSDGDIYFYVKGADQAGNLLDGALSQAAEVGTIDGYTITFPEYDIWALGDFNAENLGWYLLGYGVTMTNTANVDPNEGWTNVGTGTFVDGFMAGGLGLMPADNPWTVNVQQNNENKSMYRLDQPYSSTNCPYVSSLNAQRGYIQFDISDPTFVAVLPVFSGISNQGQRLYCTNLEGFYLDMGISKDDIIAGLGQQGVTEFSSYDAATGTVKLLNCGFTMPGEEGVYNWKDTTEEQQTGSFKFNIIPQVGIDDIAVDQNAPIEYFNLQGVRIANPEKGQLVITRQGSKTSKTIVR